MAALATAPISQNPWLHQRNRAVLIACFLFSHESKKSRYLIMCQVMQCTEIHVCTLYVMFYTHLQASTSLIDVIIICNMQTKIHFYCTLQIINYIKLYTHWSSKLVLLSMFSRSQLSPLNCTLNMFICRLFAHISCHVLLHVICTM